MADPTDVAIAAIESWFRAALVAADPEAAVRAHLVRDGRTLTVGGRRVEVRGRLVVLAVGKAAVGMARGAEAVCGDLIVVGLAITKDGHADGAALLRLPTLEATHPVPDARGEAATRRALALVGGLSVDDVLLALISGGGSALLEAPRPPVTLAELGQVTDLLLRAGAPIDDLNAVRTPLSLVKGGGLRRVAGGAAVITLILSDVLGNDPRVIASGPTVAGDADPDRARRLLDRYGLGERVPPSVSAALAAPVVTTDSGATTNDLIAVVGDNAGAVAAAEAAAKAAGMRAAVIWRERTGEAADLGRAWVAACRAAPPEIDVLLGGGEATVTVRGGGIGGRNTEFALAAALGLAESDEPRWVIASLATDGQDGPTGVAGAIADGGTIARSRAAGVDPVAALAENDSRRVFEAAGGLVRPGPTGTNVNDLYVAVRVRR